MKTVFFETVVDVDLENDWKMQNAAWHTWQDSKLMWKHIWKKLTLFETVTSCPIDKCNNFFSNFAINFMYTKTESEAIPRMRNKRNI